MIKMMSGFLMAMLIIPVAKAQEPASWKDTGMRADWTGRDMACTQGEKPVPFMCSAQNKGMVAVCWTDRQSGECGNVAAWCTYKTVTMNMRPDGVNRGVVYECN